MSEFEVIPAVDLLGESAVRLERGEFDRVVLREPEPVGLVRRFVEAGAQTLHVVDLDGARTGRMRPALIRTLAAAAAPAEVQASGGVRSPADALALLDAGATRVVVGTAAFADPDSLARYVGALGDRLVVAVDVRAGQVVGRGWTSETGLVVEQAVERCLEAGVQRVLCTAVDRDGTLTGPDLGLLRDVVERSRLPVLAAGGIRSLEDVDAIERVGCAGAIVGRALLEGGIPLAVLSRRATRARARARRPVAATRARARPRRRR
ncbi:MAG: 1-(5-phosphoribosyl)-5-[(5-phosphoribosylamino)methylideneamino] imidazole-4-carboxamide isomerase [Gaiellaceae bacterium]